MSTLSWLSSLLACPADFRLARLHNCMSQFLKINLFLSFSFFLFTHIPLVQLLWRILTCTLGEEGQLYMLEGGMEVGAGIWLEVLFLSLDRLSTAIFKL